MRDLLTLDYETYFAQDYTLRPNKLCNMNTSEYIRDDRFKAHMVGVKINAEKTFVLPHEDIKKFLKGINWKKTELLAHNTAFDGLICSHHYGAVPYVYRDTLSMARALHSNEIGASLDEVAKLYGVGNKMQDVLDQSKGIRDLHSVPGLYDTMAAYCAVDVDLCWAIYMMMTQRDKFPEHELELIHLTLQCFCDPVLRVDVPRVRKLHQAEITRKQDILEKVTGSRDLTEAKQYLGKDTWLAAELQARGVEPPMKYSVKKSASKGEDVFNYAFAKGDEAFLDLLEHEDEEVRLLVEARLEVKSALNETRALRMLNATAKPHWRLPVGYSYYGAHTGRWSGANKFNMQNLPRGGELRKCILAPVGHHIITGDSSQIEARVLAYITGNERLLDVFRSGADPYSFQATEMYGHEVVKDRSPQDDEERQIGKVAMLALGYQGGSGAFTSMAKNYGVRLPDSQVKQIVNKFRRANPEYVKFWAVCEKVIENMYNGRSGTFGTDGLLVYEGKKRNGRIRLPNGMHLKYPDIQVEYDELSRPQYSYRVKNGRKKLYSGLLCENIIQALARIAVADQIAVISRRLRLTMTTHDEGSWLARSVAAKKEATWVKEQMSVPPAWAPDLPVGSDVKHAAYYCK